MHTMIATLSSRVGATVILVLLIQTVSLRASIILEDIGNPATPNELSPGKADAGTASEVVNPGPGATKAVSPSADGAKNPAVVIPQAAASPDTGAGDVSMLDVLSKNVDSNVAKVNPPIIDPGKLASGIRPEDATLARPSMWKDPDSDVLNEDNNSFNRTADIVFAGSR